MVTQIPLSRGLVALVDEHDVALIAHIRWYAHPMASRFGGFYASARIPTATNKRTVYMHRMLLNAQQGDIIDHIDGNGLNNQRNNLRFASPMLNLANRRHYKPMSGYRGVYPTPHGKPWFARIFVNGKRTYLGRYDDKVKAAQAYDRAARAAFGDFALCNFPEGSE